MKNPFRRFYQDVQAKRKAAKERARAAAFFKCFGMCEAEVTTKLEAALDEALGRIGKAGKCDICGAGFANEIDGGIYDGYESLGVCDKCHDEAEEVAAAEEQQQWPEVPSHENCKYFQRNCREYQPSEHYCRRCDREDYC